MFDPISNDNSACLTGPLDIFLKSRLPHTPKPTSTAPTNNLLATLSAPLQLPTEPPHLTRSQRIFSIATQTDIRSLTLKDEEFRLFMDMRAEMQWATFNMTSPKWAEATREYNI